MSDAHANGEYLAEPRPSDARWDHPEIHHLNGVPWTEAPIPRRWHRCWVQTWAWLGFDMVERCACGALRNPRFGRNTWMERNSRKDRTPPPATPYMERKQAEIDRWDAITNRLRAQSSGSSPS